LRLLVAVEGKLILLDEDGTLALVEPTPKELRVLAKAYVLQNTAWTPPTLVGANYTCGIVRTLWRWIWLPSESKS